MKEQEVYVMLGKLTVRYAVLEYELNEILNVLINPDSNIVSSVISDKDGFYKVLDLIKKLTRWRYRPSTVERNKLLEIYKDADSLRLQRNEIIHGLWIINNDDLPAGTFRCSLPKWINSKEDKIGVKCRFKVKDWELSDLKELLIKLNRVIEEIQDFQYKMTSLVQGEGVYKRVFTQTKQ